MATLRLIFSMLLVAFTSSQANAAPAFLYEFSVKSFTVCSDSSSDLECMPSGIVHFPFWIEELSKMRLILNVDSVLDGKASLSIDASNSSVKIVNQGVVSLDLGEWGPLNSQALPVGRRDVPLYESAYLFSTSNRFFRLNASFDVSRYLTGHFFVDSSNSDLSMSAVGSRLWSGFINSDSPQTQKPLEFTGEWNFVRVVPEPNILLLLFGAMAAAGIALRRRSGQEQH